MPAELVEAMDHKTVVIVKRYSTSGNRPAKSLGVLYLDSRRAANHCLIAVDRAALTCQRCAN